MKMEQGNAQVDEALSALIDGETSPPEAARLLDRVEADPDLRARWARYHAGRSALAGASPDRLRPDFASRLARAVAEEPAPGRVPAWRRARLRTRQAPGRVGLALAAGVAALAVATVLALQSPGGPGSADGVRLAGLDSASVSGYGVTLTVPMLRPSGLAMVVPMGARAASGAGRTGPGALPTETRARLDDYMMSHAAFAGSGDMPAVIQTGRLVGHWREE